MSAVHPANTPVDREVQDAGLAMIALGAGLGRTREDTGRAVGTGGGTENSTSNGPVR